jgi:hypothetical protein
LRTWGEESRTRRRPSGAWRLVSIATNPPYPASQLRACEIAQTTRCDTPSIRPLISHVGRSGHRFKGLRPMPTGPQSLSLVTPEPVHFARSLDAFFLDPLFDPSAPFSRPVCIGSQALARPSARAFILWTMLPQTVLAECASAPTPRPCLSLGGGSAGLQPNLFVTFSRRCCGVG